jgi:tetratricopeptide (TPR) repeat protein/tRNA A-37 threonylcarbamoyl transferase component Bud32
VGIDNKTEKAIFDAAMQFESQAERDAYVLKACSDDEKLLASVRALLEYHDSSSFLDAPILEPDVTLDDSPLTEGPGTVIGNYKLLEQIGEGGMAVVYMAEQERPLRRRVALKIIKLGMDTKSVIARFEAERQALAVMDHPNIAKVFDAGTTETGRPYFVMELVRGVSISKYCDKNKLDTKERLDLFVQVCNAVQHAHQKGIIHRDIKPSNVMVTLHDGKPVPKVIDFGIAKATSQRLMSGLDIDTRTDIYALGVLLYELLTGATPFSEEQLREAGYVEMQRIIREEEPLKPSTKLSTLGDTLTDVAEHRKSNPDSLQKLVRGDLDWIVMKSLEKDRTRRYDATAELVADIARHLNNEPVLAGPPSQIYRLRKFMRRHRTQAIGAVIVAVLLAGMAVVSVMYFQARNRGEEAESLRHESTLSDAREARVQGDPNTALATIASILDSRHVGSEARLLHAQLVLDLQGPTAAVQELEALLSEPEDIAGQAHFLLSRIYYDSDPDALGRTEEYRRKWEHHRRQAERLLPPSADTYLLQARRAGTVRKTLELLDRALELGSGHYDSIRERAYISYAGRDFVKMLKDASMMIAIRPGHSLGYSLSAVAQRELKQFEDAIKDHNEAIKLSPNEPEFYNQRRRTYLQMERYEDALNDARTCVDLDPSKSVYHFGVFCALTALGRYDEARSEYGRIITSGIPPWTLLAYAVKHVFDSLHAGRAWHPEDNSPVGPHFWYMIEAADHYRQWAAKAQRAVIKGFHGDWSPDGKELVYSHGVQGSTGIAIWNRQTGKTQLLTIPGKDPVWSPDGQYIAYVRDRQVLPVHSIPAAQQGRHRKLDLDEVWLIKADGTEDPNFLARGNWPQWSRHSNRIFFRAPRSVGNLCSISPDDSNMKPLTPYPGDFPVISPDDRYVAYQHRNSVQVRDMSSGKLVAQWLAPLQVQRIFLNWSPDGQTLLMGVHVDNGLSRGLWIYDLKQKTASKVLSGSCGPSSWSRNDTGQIAIEKCYVDLLAEIWIAQTTALGPDQTVVGHVQEAIQIYTELIEMEPEYAPIYHSRAAYYIYLNDEERAFADLDRYVSLGGNPNAYFWLAWCVSHAPQDRVNPAIAVKLLKKARAFEPDNAWNLGVLGIAHYRAGQWQDAINAIGESIEMIDDGNGYYAFILAMAHWQAGDKDQAQTWYEWAAAYMSGQVANARGYPGVACNFYMEAAELMGLKVKYFDRQAPATGRDPQSTVKTIEDKNGNAKAGFIFGEPVNLGPTVNTGASDWGPSMSGDGLELYFHSDRLGGYDGGYIWVTTRETTDSEWWSTPRNLGPTVNSSGAGTPCISTDGFTLFFSSNRPGGSGSLDLWMTTRETKEDDWGTPVNLGSHVNSSSDDNTPCISFDGLELYFTSNRDDWKTWVTRRATKDEPWGTPVSLGSTIHSGGAAMHPSISADGLTLLFCSWRSGGHGKADIWVTTRATTDSPWTEPVNLGATVNSSRLDFAPCLSPDGSTLYFTSNRPGGLGSRDLWQVSVLPMPGALQEDGHSNLAPESVKSKDGKEVLLENNQ